MRKILYLGIVLQCVLSDSNVLRYEVGMIRASLGVLKGEMTTLKKKLKANYRPDKKNNANNKQDVKSDIVLSRYIRLNCRIEGVWSLAIAQDILCLLSRSFALMKLDHIISPYEFDNILPPRNVKNEKIYQKQAKYLQLFLSNHSHQLRRNSVIESYYYSIQHLLLSASSLSDTFSTPLIGSNPSNSSYTPSYSSVLSPEHDICNLLSGSIHKYALLSSISLIHHGNSQGKTKYPLPKISSLPKDIRSYCKKLPRSLVAGGSPASLPFQHSQPPIQKGRFLNTNELATVAHNSLPNIFLTYSYYQEAIADLQIHIMEQAYTSLNGNNAVVNVTKRIFAVYESTNLSIFSMSVLCGTKSIDSLRNYTNYSNMFAHMSPDHDFPNRNELNLLDHWEWLSLDWPEMRKYYIGQFSMLLEVISCAADVFNNEKYRKLMSSVVGEPAQHSNKEVRTNQENYVLQPEDYSSLLTIDIERSRQLVEKLKDMIEPLAEALKSIKTQAWKERLNEWIWCVTNSCRIFAEIMHKSHELSLLFHMWVDLERVYNFPLGYVLEQGSIVVNDMDEELTNTKEQDNLLDDNIDSHQWRVVEEAIELTDNNEARNTAPLAAEPVSQLNIDRGSTNPHFQAIYGHRSSHILPKGVHNDKRGSELSDDPLADVHPNLESSVKNIEVITVSSSEEETFPTLLGAESSELIHGEKNKLELDIPKALTTSSTWSLQTTIKLPFAFSALNPTQLGILNNNIITANILNGRIIQELQYWHLVNYHPSELSSCFTYSISETKKGENFNSSLSHPNAMSLFVTSNSSAYLSDYYDSYGWKMRRRGRDVVMKKISFVAEFFKLYNEYSKVTAMYGNSGSHLLSSAQFSEAVRRANRQANAQGSYSGIMEKPASLFKLENLYSKLMFSFLKKLVQV